MKQQILTLSILAKRGDDGDSDGDGNSDEWCYIVALLFTLTVLVLSLAIRLHFHCMCTELWRSVKVFSLSTNSEQSWVINFQIDKKNCDEWEKVKVICTLCKFSTINVTNRNA